MFIFCTGLHLWKRLWSFSSHWQKLFTVTNNSQNRLLDGQTNEELRLGSRRCLASCNRSAVKWCILKLLLNQRITLIQWAAAQLPHRTIVSRFLPRTWKYKRKCQFVFSYEEPESAKEKEMHILKSNWTCWARNPPTKASPAPFVSTISSLKRWIIINGFSFEFERMWRYFGMGATGKEWSFPCSTAITWNKKFPSVSVL